MDPIGLHSKIKMNVLEKVDMDLIREDVDFSAPNIL